MEAIQLKLPDGRDSGVWACGKCRRVWDSHNSATTEYAIEQASLCCDTRCVTCGAEAKRYHHYCDPCESNRWRERQAEVDAKRFEKAKKFTFAEWNGEGMLLDDNAVKWFADIEEADEWYADDEERVRPSHLWLSQPVTWSPDASGTFGDQMSDQFHEDAIEQVTDGAWKELDDAVDAWWQKNRIVSYEPDFTRCLLLPPTEARTS